MTWFDHSRRAASVLLVIIFLLAVPAVANAKFTGSKEATLSIGTDRMETPAAVTGTYKCVNGFFTEGFDVSVKGFADAGPAGATYKFALLRGNSVIKSSSSSAHAATLNSDNYIIDGSATQWSVTIQATLGSWTGPTYTRTVTCGVLSNASGSL